MDVLRVPLPVLQVHILLFHKGLMIMVLMLKMGHGSVVF